MLICGNFPPLSSSIVFNDKKKTKKYLIHEKKGFGEKFSLLASIKLDGFCLNVSRLDTLNVVQLVEAWAMK